MTKENRYICDKNIEYESSGVADKKELEEAEHEFTVKEVCDKLNEQDDKIKKLESDVIYLETQLRSIKREFIHRGILTEKEFLELIE